MNTVTVKSSTIFISTGDRIQVFRSMEEVPGPLRKKLLESTTGLNSATILIADRRGREEIARALRGENTGIRARFVEARIGRQNRRTGSGAYTVILTSWRLWASVAALAATGLAAWAVATFHF
jgi:superfamily II DNA helicase RecQ